MPPDTFVQIWNMLIDDNTLRRVFYEHDNMTFPELVRYFDQRLYPHRLLLLYTDKDGGAAGFGWFDDVKRGVRAFCSICMRKSHWGPPAEEASVISLDYIFNAHEVVRVFGVTPKPNRMALAQAKRLGFTVIAVVPGLSSYRGTVCDSTLTMMTKETFNGRWG
ncbi:hypothetical protein LCGC14_2792820 [marine sediment metagenome]|uniref:N-acetyltransferase domain-containing protein n=1 Tax=marine sediment metagenome TaxID=412755 RepID=A0A0F8YQ57_9ZZZZ